jgi:hypothetical protein
MKLIFSQEKASVLTKGGKGPIVEIFQPFTGRYG